MRLVAIFGILLGTALAQAQETPASGLTYTESFDGPSQAAMLNGAILPGGKPDDPGVWSAVLAPGAFVLANVSKPDAVRYYAVPNVVYAGTREPGTTAGAAIEATVDVRDGLGGVLIGQPEDHRYFAFTVGDDGNYLVAERAKDALRPLAAGIDPAIKTRGSNHIAVERRDDALVFLVNGAIVVTIPTSRRIVNDPVALVALGIGTVAYEDVTIRGGHPGTALPRPEPRPAPPPAKQCRLPPASPDETVIVIGAYEGEAMSSVTVAGQDEDTGVIAVTIEAGDKPLYVIATAYDPMIWRFSGAVERVAHFVAVGRNRDDGPPRVGATGLASAVVSAFTDEQCFRYFYEADKPDTGRALATIATALGRPVDMVVPAYAMLGVSLPSGQIRKVGDNLILPTPAGYDNDVWLRALHYTPGGMAVIDPKDVVSPATVEAYVVMPEEFGLAQLVNTGALELRDRRSEAYWLVKPIPAWPAGLAGAHAVEFHVAPGVTPPPGRAGHSKVIVE